MIWGLGTKRSLFVRGMLSLLLVIPIAGLVSLVAPAPPAQAVTWSECYTAFNGKKISVTGLLDSQKSLLTVCTQSDICSFANYTEYLTGRETTVTCRNLTLESAASSARNAEPTPLVVVVCGAAPTSERAYETYRTCSDSVRATYWSCDQKSDGTGETRDATVDEAASCLRTKLASPPSITKIKSAVEEGRALAANIVEEARKTSNSTINEEACKKDTTKEWVNSKCVDKTEAGETCVVDGIGWIICPVASFLGKVTDGAYSMAESLLVFEVTNPFSTDAKLNPIYSLWSNIRNVANIAFVMAFFAVIFSQATSFGISAYGIRKMLPRIVAAAILVNLSYYLCVFAIDISNIIGAGLDGLIETLPKIEQQNEPDNWESLTSKLLAGGAALGVGAAVAVWATGTLFAFLAFSLLAIITAVAIFLARHVLLIMLIILSPLAFVAFILPGTEKLFDGWRKAFIAMLVMYPLVAVLFAGSQVASRVMLLTADQAGGDISWLYKLFSLAVLAIPLFGVPWIVKFSGGFIGRVAGMVNDRGKGLVDRARNAGDAGAKIRRAELGSDINSGIRTIGKKAGLDKAGGWGYNEDGTKKKGWVRSRVARGIGGIVSAPTEAGFGKGKRADRMAAVEGKLAQARVDALSESESVMKLDNKGNETYEKRSTKTASVMARKSAGVLGDAGISKIQSRAVASADKIDSEEVQAAKTLFYYTDLDPSGRPGKVKDLLIKAVAAKDGVRARAYQEILAKETGAAGIDALESAYEDIDKLETYKSKDGKTTTLGNSLRSSLLSSGVKSKSSALDKVGLTGVSLKEAREDPGTYTRLTLSELLTQSDSSFEIALKTMNMQPQGAKDILENADVQNLLNARKKELLGQVAGVQAGSEGRLIIPRGAGKAPTPSGSVAAQRSAGGNFGGFNSEQPSPSASSQAGVVQNDYLGRPTPTKDDGTTMTNEEADEYHRRFGGG